MKIVSTCLLAAWFGRQIRAAPADSRNELLYQFTPESCAKGSFAAFHPSSMFELNRNFNLTACTPTLGIMSNFAPADANSIADEMLISNWTVDEILPAMASIRGALSFEIWIKPGDTVMSDDELRPIMSIAQQGTDEVPLDLSVCSKYHLDFLLGMRSNYLEVYYRATSAVLEPCRLIRFETLLEPHRLAHVVISLENEKQQLFVNGQGPVGNSDIFASDLTQWHFDYRLMLLNNPSFLSTPWQGTIYQLSISSRSVTMVDVQKSLQQGLRWTPPYALNYSVNLHEDAESPPGSHAPEWYEQSPAAGEARPIKLMIGSISRDVHELLASAGLAPATPLPPIYTYITGLPDKGCLYRTNGYKLGCANETAHGSLLLAGAVDDYLLEVVYIPPLNLYSSSPHDAFTTIYYCVSETLLADGIHCMSAAIRIIILSANDPPVAMTTHRVSVHEGFETLDTPNILLSGTDVDFYDEISLVQITIPPKHGYLILSVGSFRLDGLVHGVKLSDLNYTVSGTDLVAVKYIYQPIDAMPTVRDDEVTDSFQFRVADRQGVWSGDDTVMIKVVSAVAASSEVAVPIEEDSTASMNLRWLANDTSGYNRRLRFLIESLPPTETGTLFDSLTGRIILQGTLAGQVLEYPYQDGAYFTFVPALNYCNSQAMNASLSTTFRAVAFNDAQRVVSASARHEQHLLVKCHIDALVAKIPTKDVSARVIRLPKSVDTLCYGHVYNSDVASISMCDDKAIFFNGIEIESRDDDSQVVCVSITTRIGFVSFNSHAWDLTLPIHGRRSLTRNTTFYAMAGDLSIIFANLQYQAFDSGIDKIDIMLQYGSCRDATRLSVAPQPLENSNCQIIRRQITVHAAASSEARWPNEQIAVNFPWQMLLCWFGYPALYYVYVRLSGHWIVGKSGDCDGDDVTLTEGEAPPMWIQYMSEEGDYYYENTDTHAVTWLAPVGERFIPWSTLRKSETDDMA
ncbi:hypothetical protein MPSEU_000100200 [Mayamaea pseudoterrestris]|nr:hypothetical protein MPSEU_000100200 [Mayamaea pseudoterrestris]